MNKVSADVSKGLQGTAARQLDNIKKYNDQRDVQGRQAGDDQAAIVEAKNAGGRDKIDQECVKTELQKAVNGGCPTPETVPPRSAALTGTD